MCCLFWLWCLFLLFLLFGLLFCCVFLCCLFCCCSTRCRTGRKTVGLRSAQWKRSCHCSINCSPKLRYSVVRKTPRRPHIDMFKTGGIRRDERTGTIPADLVPGKAPPHACSGR